MSKCDEFFREYEQGANNFDPDSLQHVHIKFRFSWTS
jgi:hypothetical protein